MKNNKYIFALIFALGTPVCGVLAWGWTDHNSRPHKGGATHKEVQAIESRLDKRLDRFENKIDQILEHLIHHNDP